MPWAIVPDVVLFGKNRFAMACILKN